MPTHAPFGCAAHARFLFRLARQLKAQREVVRGKPEISTAPTTHFRLGRQRRAANRTGNETVPISDAPARRPLDLIVAEAMILANSTWGSWLAELGVPGIYRSQAALAPGVKVRMGTRGPRRMLAWA